MSKLDKVKYVLEQAGQPVSIQYLVDMTRFDEDLVRFMVDELKAANKVSVGAEGEVVWTARRIEAPRLRR